MGRVARILGWCAVALVCAACEREIDGLAVLPFGEGLLTPPVVDTDALMLDLSQMRGITGAGDDLNIIPTMDGKDPVDIELLAKDVPQSCRFLFAETATFGRDSADFHKITYQDPPDGALISQAAAAYPDPPAARQVFDNLVGEVEDCTSTAFGQTYVGEVTADAESLHTRRGLDCGREYHLKSVVLAEVTFCSYPESIPQIVMTNILAKVPG